MDEVILRAIERLLAMIIGGLCVYLGYHLFLCIPEQKEGEGKIEFSGGISLFVSRVGPAVVAHRADPTLLAPRRIGAEIGGRIMAAYCEKNDNR